VIEPVRELCIDGVFASLTEVQRGGAQRLLEGFWKGRVKF
jgi:hypothetical protein